MNDLNAKAKQAAESFLSRRGYDILDDGWEDPSGIVDIVSLVVLGSDRAPMWHHVNCLSVGIPQQQLPDGSDLQALPEAA